MPLPFPLPEPEPTTTAVFLLHPHQLGWIRAHAGRRGASAFMRRLLAQLIDEERQEIEHVKQQLREQREPRDRLAA
jgi:HPt (histidine-containing phosphotransfer) domain-containing protein